MVLYSRKTEGPGKSAVWTAHNPLRWFLPAALLGLALLVLLLAGRKKPGRRAA